jgi:integrase/recombinase XerD
MWARLPKDAHPHRWRQRLGIVRGFARYLATLDPASEVPSVDLLAAHRARVAPYIYSPAEIRALMTSARALTPPLRAAAFETVIGLMASTGVRLGEALGLNCADVDLEGGTLHVRAGQTKQREVPLHPTTIEALENYARLRDRHPRSSGAFFITRPGRRLTHSVFYDTFPKLRHQAGLEGRGERGHARAHDLRHTFAVRTLLDWHQAGVDIDRRLPLLSTYLGHLHPDSTYRYLQAVPELLRLVARDLDGAIEGRR